MQKAVKTIADARVSHKLPGQCEILRQEQPEGERHNASGLFTLSMESRNKNNASNMTGEQVGAENMRVARSLCIIWE